MAKEFKCVDCGRWILAANPTLETKYCNCQFKVINPNRGRKMQVMQTSASVRRAIERDVEIDEARAYVPPPPFKPIKVDVGGHAPKRSWWKRFIGGLMV